MKLRDWSGIAVGMCMCVRFLPISATAQYYLGITSGLVALVLAVMWISDEYRKDPKQVGRAIFFVIGLLSLIAVIILVIQNAPK